MTPLTMAQDAVERAMRAGDWDAYREACERWNELVANGIRSLPAGARFPF